MEGKGISYMKAQHKQVLASDSCRTELLLLVERGLLRYDEASEVLHNTTPLVLLLLIVWCFKVCETFQHVYVYSQEVSTAVFNKLLSLIKLMIKGIDSDFSKNPNGHLTSAFILLRLSCLICLVSASKKPKSPVLTCGDHATPFAASVSSYTSSSEDDDLSVDEGISPTATSQLHVNKKFLYHELFMKPQYPCLANDQFWKTVFLSAVNMLREKLGWNEKTPELYQR